MSDWGVVLGMAILTFLPRYIPFALAGKVQIPCWLARSLAYVPIAVLSSIVVQASVVKEGSLDLSLANEPLMAAIVAFITAIIFRHLFLTISVGLIVFAVLMSLD